jgi:hypothetical protein
MLCTQQKGKLLNGQGVHLGWHCPVSGDVLDHMSLLPERPVANLATERLLSSVDLEMLLEIEPFAVDEESTDRATLVIGPVVVHVKIEVFQIAQKSVAFDAV